MGSLYGRIFMCALVTGIRRSTRAALPAQMTEPIRQMPHGSQGGVHMTLDEDVTDEGRLRIIVLLTLGLVAIGGALDLYFDAPNDWLGAHVLIEVAIMVLSAGMAIYLWRGWSRASAQLASARHSIVAEQIERDAWRQRAEQSLNGLSSAIDEQFSRWGLTPSEREVALMLLKGYGHKQAAALTNRSERTARQHAVAVYEKSGLGGRAELAAFFLEGLMLPRSGEKGA